MTTYTDVLNTLSLGDLAAITSTLTGKLVGRPANKTEGVARAIRALGADPENAMSNLSSLLRSRNYSETAAKIEQALGVSEFDKTLEDGVDDVDTLEVEDDQSELESVGDDEAIEPIADEPIVDMPVADTPINDVRIQTKAEVALQAAIEISRRAAEHANAMAEAARSAKRSLTASRRDLKVAIKAVKAEGGNVVKPTKAPKAPRTPKEGSKVYPTVTYGNGTFRVGSNDNQLVDELLSEDGLTQAWIKANLRGNYSASFSTNALAEKTGFAKSVTGEGAARVFKLIAG